MLDQGKNGWKKYSILFFVYAQYTKKMDIHKIYCDIIFSKSAKYKQM